MKTSETMYGETTDPSPRRPKSNVWERGEQVFSRFHSNSPLGAWDAEIRLLGASALASVVWWTGSGSSGLQWRSHFSPPDLIRSRIAWPTTWHLLLLSGRFPRKGNTEWNFTRFLSVLVPPAFSLFVLLLRLPYPATTCISSLPYYRGISNLVHATCRQIE
jgi:hypothetical protein